MGGQARLVFLLLLSIGVLQAALSSTPHSLLNVGHDETVPSSLEAALSEEMDTDNDVGASVIKIATPKSQKVAEASTSSTTRKSATTTTHKPVSDEFMNDLIEAAKHSVALADDPRFNKMLPNKFKMENATSTNKSEESYDESYDYDDDDYYYDDVTNSELSSKKSKSSTSKPTGSDAAAPAKPGKKVEMKPIKEDNKLTSKSKEAKPLEEHSNDILVGSHTTNNNIDDNTDDYDDEDDDDEDDDASDEDDIADEEEIVFNENVPCPRYCVCARNVNSYLVATCSRFDPGTQKFGSDITDLIVADVGPKYPILLGPEFFLQMGLKQVSSIKISNCTIEYLHPDAFHGLDELYSVNLTNVGLAIINPDTFAKNKKLRMLTISGNDLSVMSNVHYLLKSSSIEELDLSRNNLMDLNPNAFSELSNIVYINLSQNNLKRIPEKVFDAVETIEELDLSSNALQTLPSTVFNRTALAILHLKYNSITGDLHFGNNDLQQLDLSFNNIKQIHHGMFDNMTGLTNLNLKGNGIKKIQADSFMTLKNLRHIDLSINELDQISSMVFYKNSELDVIRLNDNPRLSQLPPDGFLSYNGDFTVYSLDISNCAVGALGHKTFSTMPHLATLKLAWNNINNLERDTFATLNKLIELDLSNNLISRLDELMFMKNNELTKLNLAGNPIRKLSVRLFLPLTKLRELDVSECELESLMIDNQYGVGSKYRFYETLRSFNASSNQLKRISSFDVKNFKNLRTLDISHNPLKCNEAFQDFISYVSVNSKITPVKVPMMANLDSDATLLEPPHPHSGWAQLARDVCKYHESLRPKSKGDKLDQRLEAADDRLDEDAKHLMDILETSKMNKLEKILKDSRKSEVVIDETGGDSLDEDTNEEDLNDADEEKDNDEEDNNDSEYEEDASEEDEEDDYETLGKTKSEKTDVPKVEDHGLKVKDVDLNKETKDQFLLDKFLFDDDESDSGEEEEIIIERGHIYYSGYKFLIPLIVIVTCTVIILLAIVKVVTLVMRKRGERYRMALLASSKNSIVYQKLSEDIKPAAKDSKQPKVHRYSPINQV